MAANIRQMACLRLRATYLEADRDFNYVAPLRVDNKHHRVRGISHL